MAYSRHELFLNSGHSWQICIARTAVFTVSIVFATIAGLLPEPTSDSGNHHSGSYSGFAQDALSSLFIVVCFHIYVVAHVFECLLVAC